MSAADSGSSTGPGAGAPGQDDPAALVEDINRTRAELGDTVEALVAKADVKAQAKQRVAEASTQAKEKLQTMKQGLAGQASQLTGTAKRVTGTAEQARQAAAANGKTVLGAGAAGGQTVQRGAQRAAQAVGRYRVPVAAATATVAAALACWLVVRAPAALTGRPVAAQHQLAQRRKCGRERCAQTALAFFFSRSARSVSRSYSRP